MSNKFLLMEKLVRFVLFCWSLNTYVRVFGIWGGVGKSWRQTADVLLSQIPKYFEKLWLHIYLIEWRIFLPASKATDGWIRNGRKGHIKQHFWRRKRLLKKTKMFGWGGWVRKCFSSILWGKEPRLFHGHTLNFFQDFFLWNLHPSWPLNKRGIFFHGLKKKVC